jgi:hypothetical protein
LKDNFVCDIKLVVDMIAGGIREFMYDADGPAFLKRELVGFGMDKYWNFRVYDYAHGLVPIYAF